MDPTILSANRLVQYQAIAMGLKGEIKDELAIVVACEKLDMEASLGLRLVTDSKMVMGSVVTVRVKR
jgi:hypothetical protein